MRLPARMCTMWKVKEAARRGIPCGKKVTIRYVTTTEMRLWITPEPKLKMHIRRPAMMK